MAERRKFRTTAGSGLFPKATGAVNPLGLPQPGLRTQLNNALATTPPQAGLVAPQLQRGFTDPSANITETLRPEAIPPSANLGGGGVGGTFAPGGLVLPTIAQAQPPQAPPQPQGFHPQSTQADLEASMALNQGVRNGQQVLGGPRIIRRPGQTTLLTNKRVEGINAAGVQPNFIQLSGGLRQGVGPSEDLAYKYGGDNSLFVAGPDGRPVLRQSAQGFGQAETAQPAAVAPREGVARGFGRPTKSNAVSDTGKTGFRIPTARKPLDGTRLSQGFGDILAGNKEKQNAIDALPLRDQLEAKLQEALSTNTTAGARAAAFYNKQLNDIKASDTAASKAATNAKIADSQAVKTAAAAKKASKGDFSFEVVSPGVLDQFGAQKLSKVKLNGRDFTLDNAGATTIQNIALAKVAEFFDANPNSTKSYEQVREAVTREALRANSRLLIPVVKPKE